MIAFGTLFKYVMLFAALAVPGYILGKLGRIEDRSMLTMTNILTDIAMPFLVFSKLIVADMRSISISDILVCVFLPIVLELALFGISAIMFSKNGDKKKFPAECFCSVFSNCGFMGIPLVCALFPDNPDIAFYVSLYNVVSTYLLLTVGVYILSGDRNNISMKKIAQGPVLYAIIDGTFVSLFASDSGFTTYASQYSAYLANLTAPLSMLVLGFNLSRLKLSGIIKNI